MLKLIGLIGVLVLLSGFASRMGADAGKLAEFASVHGGMWSPDPPTKSEPCRTAGRGALPDRGCTPGAITDNPDKDRLCRRPPTFKVPAWLQRRVRAAYRARGPVILLIPRSLGGKRVAANAWASRPDIARKLRRRQSALRQAVCAGDLSLNKAQYQLAHDWRNAG